MVVASAMIDASLFERVYRQADAGRWSVSADAFRTALEACVSRAFPGDAPSRRAVEQHLDSLHLKDLALACACGEGHELAWEHFITEFRPTLYRAADALDRSGGARDIADSLYAELYGVRGDRRVSLFRYFHGRSSLATWLRAVLSQRFIDRVRLDRRTSPIDDESVEAMPASQAAGQDDERVRFAVLVGRALREALARLEPKDRLRLRAYYEQDLTLAQVGRLTGEHEATVSRQIAKARKVLRAAVEQQLRAASQLSDDEISRGLALMMEDAGPLDLRALFSPDPFSKIPALDRSE
jgi:RNA polymerase sigma-70 factor (ECF subfamily)